MESLKLPISAHTVSTCCSMLNWFFLVFSLTHVLSSDCIVLRQSVDWKPTVAAEMLYASWHHLCTHRTCTMHIQAIFVTNAKKRLKESIALHGKPISELRSVTCHMRSHSVTSHPTQMNAQVNRDRYSIYLPWGMARLSCPWWIFICRDGLPVSKRYPSKY